MANGNDDEGGGTEERKIRVTVDKSKELEKLQKEMAEIKEKHKQELEAKVKEAEAKGETAEKYKTMLETIAEKEFQEQKETLTKTLDEQLEQGLLPEEKVNELKDMIAKAEEEKDYEMIDRITYMATSLKEAMTIASDRVKKELEDAGLTEDDLDKARAKKGEKKVSTGIVSLLPKLKKSGDIFDREYPDGPEGGKQLVEDLYAAIRAEKAKPQPDLARLEKLKEARNELWRKMWSGEVEGYEAGRGFSVFDKAPKEYILLKEDREALKMRSRKRRG